MKTKWHLILDETSRCPRCFRMVRLLTDDQAGFYICWNCHEVRQVGVGLMKEEE